MTTQHKPGEEKDEAREQFEVWAGGKLNLPLDRKFDGEFQLDYAYEPLNCMFVGFEAGRLAGLGQAAKIAEEISIRASCSRDEAEGALSVAAAIREAEGVS